MGKTATQGNARNETDAHLSQIQHEIESMLRGMIEREDSILPKPPTGQDFLELLAIVHRMAGVLQSNHAKPRRAN